MLIREMQIKITVRDHYISTWMPKNYKEWQYRSWQHCRTRGTLPWPVGVGMVQPFWPMAVSNKPGTCLHCRTVLAKPQHCNQNHLWLSTGPTQAWTGQTLLLLQSQTLLPSNLTHSWCHLKLHLLSFSVSCVLTPNELKDDLEFILI